MRVIFMGTPEFAVPTLQALIDAPEHEVIALYSQPPRPAGRGQKERPSPTHQLAEAHGIAVHTPKSLKHASIQAQIRCHNADIAVVAAYGLLLPQEVLDAPRLGCINLHPSDLPRWRGAAPLHRTIINGDTRTAMCIMQMDAGLDTGDVLARKEVELSPTITTGELHNDMATLGAQMTLEVLRDYDQLTPIPQAMEGIAYADKIDKAEAAIDWSRNASDILNQIRGLNPYPAATTELENGERIKVFAAEHIDKVEPNNPLCFVCGDGQVLRITQAQRPGKKRMGADELLRGLRA